MPILWLAVRAPFAAFRGMQAGAYRTTMPVMPPSAAFGLVLNLASVETRGDQSTVTTLVREDLPRVEMAIGVVRFPTVTVLYQQLHSYRIGNDKPTKALAALTHGAKSWIAPGRRELLVDLDVVLGVRTERTELIDRVRRGVRGQLEEPRYGLPFVGDNNLLLDSVDILDTPPPTYWYERLALEASPRRGSCSLTVGIDRSDSTRTTSFRYAPTIMPAAAPPLAAWTWVLNPPEDIQDRPHVE